MKKIFTIVSLLAVTSFSAVTFANSHKNVTWDPAKEKRWHLGAGMGYAHLCDLAQENSANLRVFVARDMVRYQNIDFALELGTQTGFNAQLDAPQSQLNILGGTTINTVVKPFFDFLGVASKTFNDDYDFFVKLGFAYRQMFFDNSNVSAESRINPELQVGLGMHLAKNYALAVAYQGIYTGSFKFTTTGPNWVGTGSVNNVPTQHGVLVYFSVNN